MAVFCILQFMSMRKPFIFLLISVSIYLSSACSTPYYGYSERDWNQLSAEKQEKIKAEYAPILKANRDQEQQDLIEDQKQKILERGIEMRFPLTR